MTKKLIKIKLNKKKGTLFWVTGLSGSGKSSIAKEILPKIKKKFGPTLLMNGDNMRTIFNLTKYDKPSRLEYALNFSKFSEHITNQGLNIIFATIGMFHKARKRNKSRIDKYIEIFIDTEINNIIKNGKKKKIYNRKLNNIVGKHIKPQLPSSPNIKIKNDFSKNIKQISKEILIDIDRIVK